MEQEKKSTLGCMSDGIKKSDKYNKRDYVKSILGYNVSALDKEELAKRQQIGKEFELFKQEVKTLLDDHYVNYNLNTSSSTDFRKNCLVGIFTLNNSNRFFKISFSEDDIARVFPIIYAAAKRTFTNVSYPFGLIKEYEEKSKFFVYSSTNSVFSLDEFKADCKKELDKMSSLPSVSDKIWELEETEIEEVTGTQSNWLEQLSEKMKERSASIIEDESKKLQNNGIVSISVCNFEKGKKILPKRDKYYDQDFITQEAGDAGFLSLLNITKESVPASEFPLRFFKTIANDDISFGYTYTFNSKVALDAFCANLVDRTDSDSSDDVCHR